MGKLYNKAAVLEFLLAPPVTADVPISSRPFGEDGLLAAGHLRSLKDVQDLKLTPTSSTSVGADSLAAPSTAGSGGQVEYGTPQWECPITMRGMNGSAKFVYVKGCGCVVSELGLRELLSAAGSRGSSSPKGSSEKENDEDVAESSTSRKAICPVCSKTLPSESVETVTLNPEGEEKEAMAKAWRDKVAADALLKAEKKASKKGGVNGKKRKDQSAHDDIDEVQSKKAKVKAAATAAASAQPSINRKLPTLPETKKPVSAAVASLYMSKKDDTTRLSPFFAGGYSRFL